MPLTVTQFIRRQDPDALLQAYADFDDVQPFNIPVPHGRWFDSTQHGVGTAFHDAFHDKNRGGHIDQIYYHYVRALREWLFAQGAHRLWTEWEYFDAGQRWYGVTDASITGGPKPHGTLEIKVQGTDPEDGYVEDWAQLACYCQLAAQSGRSLVSQWAALAYILPRQRCIRLLMVTDVTGLTNRLPLLQAA
jgi:hypothetical protein